MSGTPPSRLPSNPFIRFLRWWLGLIICGIGLLIFAIDGFGLFGFEALIALSAAGLSIILMNVLWRVGVDGDVDREAEQQARAEFERTGRWPDDSPAA